MKDIYQCARDNDVLGLTRVLESGIDVNSKTNNNETPLHIAALNRSYEVAVALVSSGADVNFKTKHFLETPLHFAVQEGHIPTINLLLDAGADPNAKNCEGEGPIFSAIRWDQPEIISILNQRGCEINGLNRQKLTPLAVAANFQSPGLVKALLDCGATREVSGVPDEEIDFLTSSKMPLTNTIELLNKPMTANNSRRNKKNVRVAENENVSALFDIVANNQADQLTQKIKEGIDPNSKAQYTNETLLHAAVAYGASECVNLLLKAGSDVNAQTALYQETPLHIAIQEGFFDIFHDLIRNGADIESPNCEGEGPLFTAVKYDRVEMFRVLIRKGADVNKVNYGGLAPIHFCVMDNNEFLTDSLLYHGADPAKGELNPYLYAFRAGDKTIANNLEIVAPTLATATKLCPDIFKVIKEDNSAALNKFIIKGFDLNLIDVLEGSPLHCAVEHNAINCVKILVENGANINIRSIQRHETPIQIAIRKNYNEIYSYFSYMNVDYSLKNKEGENAIFYAVRQNNLQVFNDIVNKGNYVNDMNDAGLTPLYVAVSLKEKGMVQKLLENNADPSHEVHPSFKLAQEMDDKELTSLLSGAGAKTISTRTARLDARRTRGTTPTSRLGRRNKNKSQSAAEAEKNAAEEKEEKPHTEGMCYICERNKVTQKLIPCGHIVSCRGCIKMFIEDHLPCPVCKLSFYATSTVTDEELAAAAGKA